MKLGLRIAFSAALVAAIVAAVVFLDARALLTRALEWVGQVGIWGPVVFVLVYIVSTVLLLPGAILTLGAGFLFGIRGVIVVSIGSTLGATLAFLVSRYFARGWVAGKIEGNAKFRAIDKAVGDEGWRIVLLTRLSPVFPFNLLNYAYGITRVSLRHYFFASWVGMLPGAVLYVYIGSLAGSLATMGGEVRERTTLEWAFYVFGLAIAVVVTIYVTRLARRALKLKHIPA
jgi:uncharacterized membrane protein YdjX (TVP38/TMEM64 family)